MKGKILTSVLIGLALALVVVSCDDGTQTVTATDPAYGMIWYSGSGPIDPDLISLGFDSDNSTWEEFIYSVGVQAFKSDGKDSPKAVKDGDPIKGKALLDELNAIYTKKARDGNLESVDWTKTKFADKSESTDKASYAKGVAKKRVWYPVGTDEES
jgi:hypothetical protein